MATSMRSWAHAQIGKGKQPVYLYMFAHEHSYASGIAMADPDLSLRDIAAQLERMRDFRAPTWDQHFARVEELLEKLA